jgi:hypothetical protein
LIDKFPLDKDLVEGDLDVVAMLASKVFFEATQDTRWVEKALLAGKTKVAELLVERFDFAVSRRMIFTEDALRFVAKHDLGRLVGSFGEQMSM